MSTKHFGGAQDTEVVLREEMDVTPSTPKNLAWHFWWLSFVPSTQSLSLTPHKWNYFLCMTHKVSLTLLHWPSYSSSGSQWSTGAQLLGFLPCMNFRAKCHPALKLSVDFSSKFKTLVNLFTAAVAVINVLYVFPFWKINTRGLTKIIRVQKCCDLRSL